MKFDAIKKLGSVIVKTATEAVGTSTDKINLKKDLFKKESVLVEMIMNVYGNTGELNLVTSIELKNLLDEIKALREKDSKEFAIVSAETKSELKTAIDSSVVEGKSNMGEKFKKKSTEAVATPLETKSEETAPKA